jgi:hypothetical protein
MAWFNIAHPPMTLLGHSVGGMGKLVCPCGLRRTGPGQTAPSNKFGGATRRECYPVVNQANFSIAHWGLRIERGRLRAGAGGKMRKTNPIWPGGRINVRNEPNFAPAQATGGRNCPKRSQTWGEWGRRAKATVVWSVARPGSETCKTNPILGPGAPRFRIGDCGLQEMSGGDAQPPIRSGAGTTKSRIVQNEPNLG